jgi:hypothetical protein
VRAQKQRVLEQGQRHWCGVAEATVARATQTPLVVASPVVCRKVRGVAVLEALDNYRSLSRTQLAARSSFCLMGPLVCSSFGSCSSFVLCVLLCLSSLNRLSYRSSCFSRLSKRTASHSCVSTHTPARPRPLRCHALAFDSSRIAPRLAVWSPCTRGDKAPQDTRGTVALQGGK